MLSIRRRFFEDTSVNPTGLTPVAGSQSYYSLADGGTVMQIGESNAVTFEVDTESWGIPNDTLALVCVRMKLSHEVPSDPSYWYVQNNTLEDLGPYGDGTCNKQRDSYIAMAYAHTTDVSARDVSLPLYVPIVPAKTNTLKIWVTQQVVVSSVEHSDVRLFGKNTVFISGAPTAHYTCGTLSFTERS